MNQPGNTECLDDRLVNSLLSGEMSPAKREQVSAHLATCGRCTELIASAESERELSSQQTLPLNPDFTPCVLLPDKPSLQSAMARRSLHNIPSDVEPPAPLPAELGRYRVQCEIGRGGFGRVLKAFDPRLNCDVAVKLLHESEDSESLLQEARTLASLQHPAIVPVLNVSEVGQPSFVVMSFVDGRSLRQVLRDETLPLIQVVKVLTTVCEAVAFAHASGIVHRDLKPANILIDVNDRVFVTDFGLALRTDRLLNQTEIVGTPDYMSPEQVRGDLNFVDERTDVWALGATLFAMLAGRPPFRRQNREQTLNAILSAATPSLRELRPELPPVFDAICRRCLQKDISERYESVNDLLEDLRCLSNPSGHRMSLGYWLQVRVLRRRPPKRRETFMPSLAAADRRFGTRIGMFMAAFLILVIGINEYRSRSLASDLVMRIQSSETSGIANLLSQSDLRLSSVSSMLKSKILEVQNNGSSAELFRLRLAEVLTDSSSISQLVRLLPSCSPVELMALKPILESQADLRSALLSAIAKMPSESYTPGERLRIESIAWIADDSVARTRSDLNSKTLATRLIHEDLSTLEGFADLLRDSKHALKPALSLHLSADASGSDREQTAIVERAVVVLIRWCEDRREYLDLLKAVPADLLDRMIPLTEKYVATSDLLQELTSTERAIAEEQQNLKDATGDAETIQLRLDRLAEWQGKLALAMAATGERKPLLRLLTNAPDPRVRTWLIEYLSEVTVFESLLPELMASEVPCQVSATLLAMWNCELSPEMEARVSELFRVHPDPGVHSAAGWLLRSFGRGDLVDRMRRELVSEHRIPGRGWIEHPSGLTFAVLPRATFLMGYSLHELEQSRRESRKLDIQRTVTLEEDFAIATTELLPSHLNEFGLGLEAMPPRSEESATTDKSRFPIYVSRKDAEFFCDKFSERWNVKAFLPGSDQWEYACRAETTTQRFTGHSEKLLRGYAVYESRSREAVGSRRPNAFGLFDMLGNAPEWCSDEGHTEAMRQMLNGRAVCRGYDFKSLSMAMKSATYFITSSSSPYAGVRLCLRVPPSE